MLQQKSFGEKILGTLPSLSHALGTRGAGICVASVRFRSDSVLCLQGKETKLRLVEASTESTTKLQLDVLKM